MPIATKEDAEKGVPRRRPPVAGEVRRMFAEVAPRYDLLNHTLSAGVDVLWRRRTVRRGLEGRRPEETRVLDLCTGTGDLALAFGARGCEVVGTDFCLEMLLLGRRKLPGEGRGGRVRFFGADAQHLPFRTGSFDLATVAFGLRNVEDPLLGLRQMRRVLRPGGRALILEFSRPRAPILGPLFLWYFRRILPRIGSWISPGSRRSRAYAYLPRSVLSFPEREAFLRIMEEAGFVGCGFELLSFGIAALYMGGVPEEA